MIPTNTGLKSLTARFSPPGWDEKIFVTMVLYVPEGLRTMTADTSDRSERQ